MNSGEDVKPMKTEGVEIDAGTVEHVASLLVGDGYVHTAEILRALRTALTARAEHEETLRVALRQLLTRYLELVNCGDCGNWNPEKELEVIDARAALTSEKANG